MTAEQVARDHYADRKRLSSTLGKLIKRLWSGIDPADLDSEWAQAVPSLILGLTGAQQVAAGQADDYVAAALEEQGLDSGSDGELDPGAFAGVASDGRPLDGLLRNPITVVKAGIAGGATVEQAMAAGYANLDMLVRTQLADAGRAADQVSLVSRPDAAGYVRMLVGSSCSRCAILAGRWYRWNAGFNRHPRCDCIGLPGREDTAGDVATDPRAYFDSLSRAEQDKVFTKAGAEAIRDGADMNRVVNARRGMYQAGDLQLTREATTRRGINRKVRLMPEQIYKIAGNDRDEALRLLRTNGYLIGKPAAPKPAPPVMIKQPAPAPVAKAAPKPPAPAPKPAAPTLEQRVKTGIVDRQVLSGGQNARTELLTLGDGSKVVFKKAKPVEGRSARSQQDAEELAPMVLRAVGIRAPEIYRPTANQLYMEYFEGDLADKFRIPATYRIDPAAVDPDEAILLGLADQLMDNYDRNSGNWLIVNRSPRPIDHGFAFSYYGAEGLTRPTTGSGSFMTTMFHGPPGKTYFDWQDVDIAPADMEVLRSRLQALRPDFERVGRPEWHDAVMTRLDIIAGHAKGIRRRIR